MIENPNLTLDILKIFAETGTPWPANLSAADIKNRFQNVSWDTIEYHLICAIDSKLLHGNYSTNVAFDGTIYTVGWLDGLTVGGNEYVRNASNPKILKMAKEHLILAGIEITTKNLINVIEVVTNNLLSNISA